MNVSAPFIKRPVATSLIALAMLLCGLLGYLRLPISPLPQVDFPTIQVTTQLPGANPETIASLVTGSLERQFGQVPSLTSMSSQSSFGLSQITLQFNLDRDIDSAAQDVQSAINAAASTLPKNLPYPPVYAKVNPADTPIMTLVLRSKTASLRQLSDYADTLIAPQISQVSGVGRVSVQGGVRPAVRIEADLARLAANRIGMEDLRQAIGAANIAGAKGSLDGQRQAYTLDANDQIFDAKQYESIVVVWRNNAPVMVRDVAHVVEGLENARVGGWYNGEQSVVLDVLRQPGANIINTVEQVKAGLPKLMPESMTPTTTPSPRNGAGVPFHSAGAPINPGPTSVSCSYSLYSSTSCTSGSARTRSASCGFICSTDALIACCMRRSTFTLRPNAALMRASCCTWRSARKRT